MMEYKERLGGANMTVFQGLTIVWGVESGNVLIQ